MKSSLISLLGFLPTAQVLIWADHSPTDTVKGSLFLHDATHATNMQWQNHLCLQSLKSVLASVSTQRWWDLSSGNTVWLYDWTKVDHSVLLHTLE